MPGRLSVRVHKARNLPVMDRAADTTDAYVEMHFADTTYKTEIFAKSLNPAWQTDWFVFEADDEELQDNCLIMRCAQDRPNDWLIVFQGDGLRYVLSK